MCEHYAWIIWFGDGCTAAFGGMVPGARGWMLRRLRIAGSWDAVPSPEGRIINRLIRASDDRAQDCTYQQRADHCSSAEKMNRWTDGRSETL